MTARSLAILAFALTAAVSHAVDITKLPPMNNEGRPADVELKGREVAAIDVALRQFREDRFSTSGDLKHFTVELHRHPGKLAVSFFPEYHPPSQRGLPGRNKHGTYITYFVSLRTFKVVGYTFQRD